MHFYCGRNEDLPQYNFRTVPEHLKPQVIGIHVNTPYTVVAYLSKLSFPYPIPLWLCLKLLLDLSARQ